VGVSSFSAVVVSISSRSSPLSSSFTWDMVIASHIGQRQNVPTTGNSLILISGASFGSSDSTVKARLSSINPVCEQAAWVPINCFVGIRFGSCQVSIWISSSSLKCKSVSSYGSAGLSVTMDRMHSELSSSLTFDAQTISAVVSKPLAFTGCNSLTVFGQNFGTVLSSFGLRVGSTACLSLHWQSSSTVACKSSPIYHRLFDVVASLTSVSSQAYRVSNTTFASPAVRLTTPGQAPGSGSIFLSVTGAGFGTRDFSSVLSAQISGTHAQSTAWKSDSQVVMKSCASVARFPIVGVSMLQNSVFVSRSLSYIGPTLSSASLHNIPASGSVILQ